MRVARLPFAKLPWATCSSPSIASGAADIWTWSYATLRGDRLLIMQATKTGRDGAPSLVSQTWQTSQTSHASPSPPKARAPFLAALAISSFAAFRSQPAAPAAVQSPVRRKPLPPGSPAVGRYSPAELNSGPKPAAADNDVNIPNPPLPPAPPPRRVDAAAHPPLTQDDFVPRNLDE
jgi:hypothetical protein